VAVASTGPYANLFHFTPESRQITTPASHHPIFMGWMLFLALKQQCQNGESIEVHKSKVMT